MKKYIQAIIKVPIEVLENGSYNPHMNYAMVDFAPLDALPFEKTSKDSILEKLRIIKSGSQTIDKKEEKIEENQENEKNQEEKEEKEEEDISYSSESSFIGSDEDSSLELDSRTSTIDSESEEIEIEEEDEDSSIEEDRKPILIKENKENEINNLIDIFNLFIQPDEMTKKKKPKNITFKKKRHNNKRFTARVYTPSN